MKPVSVPHLPSCLQEPSRAWSRPTLCSERCTPDPKPNPAKAAATASPRPQHLPQHRPCRAPRGTQLHQEWPWLPSGHVGAPGEWELEVSGAMGGPEGWEGRCPCTGRAAHPAALGGEQSSCCPSAGMRRGMGFTSWRSEQIFTWPGGEVLWENAAGPGRKEIPPAEPPSREGSAVASSGTS